MGAGNHGVGKAVQRTGSLFRVKERGRSLLGGRKGANLLVEYSLGCL